VTEIRIRSPGQAKRMNSQFCAMERPAVGIAAAAFSMGGACRIASGRRHRRPPDQARHIGSCARGVPNAAMMDGANA